MREKTKTKVIEGIAFFRRLPPERRLAFLDKYSERFFKLVEKYLKETGKNEPVGYEAAKPLFEK